MNTVQPHTSEGDCFHCEFGERQAGGYVRCLSPDTFMVGSEHAVKHGFFDYPEHFLPAGKAAECANFKRKE